MRKSQVKKPGVQVQDDREPHAISKASPSTGGDDQRFPVVAIGASAGGLAALKTLFANVPKDSGAAYVVIVHLSPEHESHLEELLQPHVKIPVHQVTATTPLEKNHVYLIPPNANLDVFETHLRTSGLENSRHQRAPIDHFFRTLAKTHGGRAIGVVLTGTGSDGTLGLRQIKESGGLAVVQNPAEAEYDGMPTSAITATPVDLVLPLAQIPQAIIRFANTEPRVAVPAEDAETGREARRFLQRVIVALRTRTGRDFGHYRSSTLLRRLMRRMQFHQLQEPSAYLEFMRKWPTEARALADDLLINTTSFFRDAEVFETLKKDVIPRLFAEKTANDTVRIWSVGCATGEEAYSLAILLLEEASGRTVRPTIQVFATDLHQQSIDKAREGFYPGDIETDVGPQRLQRFFVRESGGYRVRRDLRDLIVFAHHNVLADPPFSRLDLISCRNLFVYLDRDLHQRVTKLFHYSLKPDGYLLLGPSEYVDSSEIFQLKDQRHSIFKRLNVAAAEPRMLVSSPPPTRPPCARPTSNAELSAAHTENTAYRLMHQRMLDQYAPPSVLLGPDDHVAHFSARAGRYLSHPGGTPTTNVFKLVRDELRVELKAAVSTARAQLKAVRSSPISLTLDGHACSVVLDARPARDAQHERYVLLIFDEQPAIEAASAAHRKAGAKSLSRTRGATKSRQLEADNKLAKEQLQRVIKESETNQEELRATNEELQSANEELRSTLEELETDKEEIQSVNEELQTVNQENRHKVDELRHLSSDLQTLFEATDIATIFLDRELRILRFTPRITGLFNVQVTDRGRLLSDLTHRLGYDDLQKDALQVLNQLIPVEHEVHDQAGRWYLMRVLPYRDIDRIAGVVVTFVEITSRKEMEDSIRRAKEYSEHIIETLPEPLLVLTPDLKVKSANAAFYAQFAVEADQTIGCKIYDLGNGQWDIPSLRELLEKVLPDNSVFKGYQVDHQFQSLGRRVMVINGRRLEHQQLILLGISDITDRHRAEEEREKLLKEAHQADRRKNEFLAMLSHELRNPLMPIRSGLYILDRALPGGEQARRAQAIIGRQVAQMSRLIDDLLDITRVTRGKVQLQRERLDLSELAQRALEDNRAAFLESGVDLQWSAESASGPVWVDGDRTRLAQVIGNLLQNAAKFTPRHGFTRVSVWADTRHGKAFIRVVDTGRGLAPEIMPHLFQPFIQAEATLDRKKGGLGLGLALVKGLVEMHGGSVSAASDGIGAGASFTIVLPLQTNAPVEKTALNSPSATRTTTACRVLIIEDNADAADNLREALQLNGHRVQVAHDGSEGLEKARAFVPEVVICDIGLPEMDGYEVARAVRADPKLANVTLVALTGYAGPENVAKAREAGFDSHLAKPPSMEAMERVLHPHQ